MQKAAFTGRLNLQVAVKHPIHQGVMEGDGTATANSYTPQLGRQVVGCLSQREGPDGDERSNGEKSDLEMSHICPRRKEDYLQNTKQISHSDSLFAVSAVQSEELVQQGIK